MSYHQSPRGGAHTRGYRKSKAPAIIALAVAMVVLFAAGFGIMWLIRGSGNDSPTPVTKPSDNATVEQCIPEQKLLSELLPDPSEVTVNVYNGTSAAGDDAVAGLAARVAEGLKEAGFIEGEPPGNDETLVEGVAEIRHGAKGAEAAQLVALYFPGATLVEDGRKGSNVDVSAGQAFEEMASESVVEKELAETVEVRTGPGCEDDENVATDDGDSETPAEEGTNEESENADA